MLDEVGLSSREHLPADVLSHGDRRLLDLAMALASDPRLLLLDEPTAGMSPAETRQTAELIPRLAGGRTVILVEHDMDVVMSIATSILVLARGAKLAKGTPVRSRATPASRKPIWAASSKREAPCVVWACCPRHAAYRVEVKAGRGFAVLVLDDVHAYYGQSHVLQGMTLTIEQGAIVSLLGRNGVGKTTTLRTIMGLNPPRRGRILYHDRAIQGLPPHRIANRGIQLVPEDRGIFPALSVRENLEVGAARPSDRARATRNAARVFEYFPILRERLGQTGGSLSGGEQQQLTIARALMTGPELLLLDEPCEGLAPLIVQTLLEAIREIRADGTTVLLRRAERARGDAGGRAALRDGQRMHHRSLQLRGAAGRRGAAHPLPGRLRPS